MSVHNDIITAKRIVHVGDERIMQYVRLGVTAHGDKSVHQWGLLIIFEHYVARYSREIEVNTLYSRDNRRAVERRSSRWVEVDF